MKITIDWVTMSLDARDIELARAMIDSDRVVKRGHHGYESHERGGRGYMNYGGRNGNVSFAVTGSNHRCARECLALPYQRVTRLDLALDVHDPKLISVITSALRLGHYSGMSKSTIEITKRGRLQTLNVGSRESEKYVRWYDKSAEQGLSEGVSWWRLEFELKGELATAVADLITQGSDLGEVLRGLVSFRESASRFSAVASFWASLAYNKVKAVISRKKTTYESRAVWLEKQCLRAISEAIERGGLGKKIYDYRNQCNRAKLGASEVQGLRWCPS